MPAIYQSLSGMAVASLSLLIDAPPGIALLLLQRSLEAGDGGGHFVHTVGVLVHQVLHHTHALVKRLLHVGHLILQRLHLSLKFYDLPANGPSRSDEEKRQKRG